jgi:CheY-like chemotaxis protein
MSHAQAQTCLSGERAILVVEDEVLIRILICDALRDAGARVVEAENADEALAYLAADPSLHLVFSDVRMPGSMDGLQLLSRIAADFPHVKTVLTSGHLSPSEAPGDTLLITKPYPCEKVASQLIGLIDEQRSGRHDEP